MADDVVSVEDAPQSEDVAALDERLYEHNAAVTRCHDGRWLAIFVRDGTGSIVAGLHGWTWGGTGFVRSLWVREDLRGQGLGRRLLTAAEAEAVRRGCRVMRGEPPCMRCGGRSERQAAPLSDGLPRLSVDDVARRVSSSRGAREAQDRGLSARAQDVFRVVSPAARGRALDHA